MKRFNAVVALGTVVSVACLAACDDGGARPAAAPLPAVTAPARESKDPPPAKPPEIIDNSVGATTADGGAAAADAAAAKGDGGKP